LDCIDLKGPISHHFLYCKNADSFTLISDMRLCDLDCDSTPLSAEKVKRMSSFV